MAEPVIAVTSGYVDPSGSPAVLRQQISEEIDAIDPRDIPFLAALGWSSEAGASMGADSLSNPCTQPTYSWQNDTLIPYKTKLRLAHVAADGTLAVSTSTGVYYRVGEHVLVSSLGNTSHYEISGVAGDALAVTVIQGDAAHAIDVEVVSLGIPKERGEQFEVNGRFTVPGSDSNFTEIFSDTAAVTGTEQSTEYVGINDRLDREVFKTLQQLVIKLEIAAQYNERSANVNAVPTRFGGLHYFVRTIDTTGIFVDAAGANIGASNEGLLKDQIDECYNRGGKPNTLMCGTFQRRQISNLLIPFVRTEMNQAVYGVVVGSYEYHHGIMQVVLNRYTRADHLWGLSMDMIGMGPLKGNGVDRSFSWFAQPKTGDYEARTVLGEMTMEVRNRNRAHFLIEGLATVEG